MFVGNRFHPLGEIVPHSATRIQKTGFVSQSNLCPLGYSYNPSLSSGLLVPSVSVLWVTRIISLCPLGYSYNQSLSSGLLVQSVSVLWVTRTVSLCPLGYSYNLSPLGYSYNQSLSSGLLVQSVSLLWVTRTISLCPLGYSYPKPLEIPLKTFIYTCSRDIEELAQVKMKTENCPNILPS